jgi:cell division protein FtsL
MSKEKVLSATLIIVGLVFAVYFCYDNYQEKKQLKKANTELYERIEQLNQSIAKSNQIIADNERNKRDLENQSLERLEQINDQLKNNDCANEYSPSSVSDSVYNRAKNIRYSANTVKSTR